MPSLDKLQTSHDEIECYCMILGAYSETSRCPTSPSLTVDSAHKLAQDLEIPLQALNEDTSIRAGIPATLDLGNALLGKQIVCGKGDAVRREFPRAFDQPYDAEAHDEFVDRVGTCSVLLLLLVGLGHLWWKR